VKNKQYQRLEWSHGEESLLISFTVLGLVAKNKISPSHLVVACRTIPIAYASWWIAYRIPLIDWF